MAGSRASEPLVLRGDRRRATGARYAEGRDEQGQPITVVDSLAEQTMTAARQQDHRPTALLEQRDLFGDLVDPPRFVDADVRALHHLKTRGARATLEHHLDVRSSRTP